MKKIFTFSFDDGTVQDKRLIAMLKKYGFTATFNLSSGLFGYEYSFDMNGHHVVHTRLSAEEAKEVYKGFEVAAHTRTHNCLRLLPRKEIIEEVVPDYIALSELFGYPVRGLAYAWGGTNYDRLSTDILQNDTNICYARNVEESGTLNFPENFLEWHPSAHILSADTDRLLSEFEKAENDCLLYIWGHTFELDFDNGWERTEKILERLSEIDGAVCMTNMQIYREITGEK